MNPFTQFLRSSQITRLLIATLGPTFDKGQFQRRKLSVLDNLLQKLWCRLLPVIAHRTHIIFEAAITLSI